MLKESLYRLLGQTAGGVFNILNVLMGGNLPPFGSVCIVVREKDRYLLLEQLDGKTVLPGGFMRWREDPVETAQRECEEETGLQVRVLEMIGCFSCPAPSLLRMSTLTLVYSAEIAGGYLRQALEGRPCWVSEAEARERLDSHYQPFFEGYTRHAPQQAPYLQEARPERRGARPRSNS